MRLWVIAFVVFLLNLPFGYWRENVKKFSLQWFLAVHVPVPFVIALRILGGLGFQFVTYPALVGAFSSDSFPEARCTEIAKNWNAFPLLPAWCGIWCGPAKPWIKSNLQ